MGYYDDQDEPGTGLVEVLPPMSASGAATLDRAAIDQQIATAKKYPRNLKRAQDMLQSLVTMDLETSEECQYALVRGKGRDAKPIIGPSIRFAEIAQICWGNMRSVARIIDEGKEFITANAIVHDLESNTASSQDVIRRIVGANGRRYGVDMIAVTGNAAVSIALRNSILRVIPKPFWRPGFAAVQQVLIGDIKTLVQRRDRAIHNFANFGVTPEMICAKLQRASVPEITLDDLGILYGFYNAIREGELRMETVFLGEETVDRQDSQGFNPLGKAATESPANEAGADDNRDRGGSDDHSDAGGTPAGDANVSPQEVSPPKPVRTAAAANVEPKPKPAAQPAATAPAKAEPKPAAPAKKNALPPAPKRDVLKEFESACSEAASLDDLKSVSDEYLPLLQRLAASDYTVAEGIYNKRVQELDERADMPSDPVTIDGHIEPEGEIQQEADAEIDPAEAYRLAAEGEPVEDGEADTQPEAPAATGLSAADRAIVMEHYGEARPEKGAPEQYAAWDELALHFHKAKAEHELTEIWDANKALIDSLPQNFSSSLRIVRFMSRKRISGN